MHIFGLCFIALIFIILKFKSCNIVMYVILFLWPSFIKKITH